MQFLLDAFLSIPAILIAFSVKEILVLKWQIN